MKHKPLVRACSLLLGVAVLVGCQSPVVFDDTGPYKGKTADQIRTQANELLGKQYFREATKALSALEVLYPYQAKSEENSLDLMYAQYQAGEKAQAVATADRFIRIYPQSRYLDYVYYMRGLCRFSADHGVMQRYMPVNVSTRDNDTSAQAFDDFATVVQRYPQSRYAADARQRMVFLRNLFAQRDVAIAEFYFERGAYVAAINRATNVVAHYQRSNVTWRALNLMHDSYVRLGLTQEAERVQKIIDTNYSSESKIREGALASPPLIDRLTRWWR